MLKSDADQSGVLSPSEQLTLLSDLGNITKSGGLHIDVHMPLRVSDPIARMEEAGLVPPLETKYEWTAADGYPLVRQNSMEWPDYGGRYGHRRTCSIVIESCFPKGFGGDTELKTEDVFKKLAFESPNCGDCAIMALLSQSGEAGLEAFLPKPREGRLEGSWWEQNGVPEHYELVGGQGSTWSEASYEPSAAAKNDPRTYAVRNIQRYQYAIGELADRLTGSVC